MNDLHDIELEITSQIAEIQLLAGAEGKLVWGFCRGVLAHAKQKVCFHS